LILIAVPFREGGRKQTSCTGYSSELSLEMQGGALFLSVSFLGIEEPEMPLMFPAA